MKWILFLVLWLISCIASNTAIDSRYDIVYIDGCQYIITAQGGITLKAGSCYDK